MIEISTTEFLSRHAPFDRLEPETIRFLVNRLELLHFADGRRIAGPDSGRPQYLHIILHGKVRVKENGDSGAANWTISEGECFPIGALSGNRPTTNYYDAVSELDYYALPVEHFSDLLDISKVFARYCSNYLSNLLSESRRKLQTRIAQFCADQQPLSAELRQLITRPPVWVTSDATLQHALELMVERQVGSMIVVDDAHVAIGILTQSDVLRRVTLAKIGLNQPISTIMTINPLALPENACVFEAIFAMSERGIRHVVVVDKAGRLTGVVSERDLFATQRNGMVYIRGAIESATSSTVLARSVNDTHQFAMHMLAQGTGADHITRFISALNDAVTKRVIEINLQSFDLSGVEWTWLAFGSEGREEQTFSTDQDNGIVFSCQAASSVPAAKARLLAFAQAVNIDLDRCGYPLCTGNIMAGNPEWCLTLDEWQGRFTNWVFEPNPQALLNASIFFDFRAIYGKASLADDMHRHLFSISRSNAAFQRMLAANALCAVPPLGMFHDFVTEIDTGGERYIDLKKFGARLFVDAARVFALADGIQQANTVQRLRRAATIGSHADDNEAIIEAFNFIQLLRLRQQQAEIEQGRPASNRFPPARLNQLDHRILKEALRQARRLQQRLNLNYQLSMF